MKLEEAQVIAQWLKKYLEPFSERIEIAGSIRRQSPEINDVELLVIPRYGLREEKVPPKDLFTPSVTRNVKVNQLIEGLHLMANIQWIKPGTRDIIAWPLKSDAKYIRGYIPSKDLKVDIFTATPENWGLQFAIRTGSANYSHKTLAVKWCKLGYSSIKGMLTKKGKEIPVREETDLYRLLNLPFVEPQFRN